MGRLDAVCFALCRTRTGPVKRFCVQLCTRDVRNLSANLDLSTECGGDPFISFERLQPLLVAGKMRHLAVVEIARRQRRRAADGDRVEAYPLQRPVGGEIATSYHAAPGIVVKPACRIERMEDEITEAVEYRRALVDFEPEQDRHPVADIGVGAGVETPASPSEIR